MNKEEQSLYLAYIQRNQLLLMCKKFALVCDDEKTLQEFENLCKDLFIDSLLELSGKEEDIINKLKKR